MSFLVLNFVLMKSDIHFSQLYSENIIFNTFKDLQCTETVEQCIDILTELAEFFGVSIDYLAGRSDVRKRADEMLSDGFSAEEWELLELFRGLGVKERSRALGMVYALKHYND